MEIVYLVHSLAFTSGCLVLCVCQVKLPLEPINVFLWTVIGSGCSENDHNESNLAESDLSSGHSVCLCMCVCVCVNGCVWHGR